MIKASEEISEAFRKIGSGGWIRTNDLRVMSPTSYQTAPPRIKFFDLRFGFLKRGGDCLEE